MSKKKSGFKSQLASFWQELNPKTKKKITVTLVLVVFILVSLLGYYATHHSNATKNKRISQQGKPIDIQLQPGLLQATINNKVSQQLKQMQQQVSILKKQFKQLQSLRSLRSVPQQTTNNKNNKPTKGVISKQQTTNRPPVPMPPALGGSQSFSGGSSVPRKALKQGAVIIGGIGIARNNSASKIAKLPSSVKKKGTANQVYLPTCFMEASLLSGLDAPTMNGAKGNPVPVLLRVRAPAILPNRVKANLKGCFIIAEGYGDLASERVYLRLVNLSCIAKNGQAVIDQPVKGFVVGSDGKIGLRGRVVSKMGAVLARAALAGFLQGFGNAINSSSWTTWTTSAGTSSTLNASDVSRAAIGGGVSAASKKLAEFYMKLADQTLPVIEVGATRRVTVVISQGTMLKLRNVCIGGEKCEQ